MKFSLINISYTYFITGSSGFIGFHLSRKLLEIGVKVIGFDNMNDYYDVTLKEARLNILKTYTNYSFVKGDLANKKELEDCFKNYQPDIVINLGAQAGVRYSIDNPDAYVQSNLVGFLNILECCRNYPVKHFVYASSSSVYGGNDKVPFSTDDKVDQPVSLYAATKKSNELMAYAYSKLYEIPSTGLRFFTVYGPFGRPDMAYFKFADKITKGQPIQIYNNGDLYRDFTYIDDIVQGIENILCNPPKADDKGVHYKVYNIGNNQPVKLMDFISVLEDCLGQVAVKEYYPMQEGDVYQTYADVSQLMEDFNFKPSTSIKEGLTKFVEWYIPWRKGNNIRQSMLFYSKDSEQV